MYIKASQKSTTHSENFFWILCFRKKALLLYIYCIVLTTIFLVMMLLYNSHLSICMATGNFFALYLRYKAEMFGEDSYAICASTQKLFFSVCLFKKNTLFSVDQFPAVLKYLCFSTYRCMFSPLLNI